MQYSLETCKAHTFTYHPCCIACQLSNTKQGAIAPGQQAPTSCWWWAIAKNRTQKLTLHSVDCSHGVFADGFQPHAAEWTWCNKNLLQLLFKGVGLNDDYEDLNNRRDNNWSKLWDHMQLIITSSHKCSNCPGQTLNWPGPGMHYNCVTTTYQTCAGYEKPLVIYLDVLCVTSVCCTFLQHFPSSHLTSVCRRFSPRHISNHAGPPTAPHSCNHTCLGLQLVIMFVKVFVMTAATGLYTEQLHTALCHVCPFSFCTATGGNRTQEAVTLQHLFCTFWKLFVNEYDFHLDVCLSKYEHYRQHTILSQVGFSSMQANCNRIC